MIILVIFYFVCSISPFVIDSSPQTTTYFTQDKLIPIRRNNSPYISSVQSFSSHDVVELVTKHHEDNRKLPFITTVATISTPQYFSPDVLQNSVQDKNSSFQLGQTSENFTTLEFPPKSSAKASGDHNASSFTDRRHIREKRYTNSCRARLLNSGETVSEQNWMVQIYVYAGKLPLEIKAEALMCCTSGPFPIKTSASSSEIRFNSLNTWVKIEIMLYQQKVNNYYQYAFIIKREFTEKQVINNWTNQYGLQKIDVSVTGEEVTWVKSDNQDCPFSNSTFLLPQPRSGTATTTSTTERVDDTTTSTTERVDVTTTSTTERVDETTTIHQKPPQALPGTNSTSTDDSSLQKFLKYSLAPLIVLLAVVLVLVTVMLKLKRSRDARSGCGQKPEDVSRSHQMSPEPRGTTVLLTSNATISPTTPPQAGGDAEAEYYEPPECYRIESNSATYVYFDDHGNPVN